MEIGTVRQIDINAEMQDAYLDYAMSVIVARALPDVRDGLKPVHRRILYAMHDMGLTPDKPYRKSARIVGEVLGKYHPHGDAAVYDSMVRMAQDFSMRYPLVDGQGNFGSIDGDEAAAMRYTEARLAPIAMEMMRDIDKETVAFGPNFDGILDEPLVLPSALPNFLVNGASGIAVGMATNVPPHNLREVCDALSYMIEHYDSVDDLTVDDLMQFVRGPDFPTGGIVYRYDDNGKDGQNDVIKSAYAVGRGRFIVQARTHLEEMSRNRTRIVVTELPYQVNKTRLIERIADLARDGRIDGVVDLRDESDRQGMRLVIELTRTVDAKEILAKLFKLTPMKMTFGVNMLALVDGEPKTLSLKRALWHYLQHRQEIVTRRTQFALERARRQAHILEGLLIALDNLDEVIDTIRRSQNADTARTNLIRKFRLTELQAQAILEMPLRRLAALEQKKIREEYKEKLALIAYLEDLLGDPRKILGVVGEELKELRERYGDARRTQLVERTADVVLARDLVAEEDVIVAVSGGKIWREPQSSRRRGTALSLNSQGLSAAARGRSTDDLALFTADGQGALIPMHQVPAGPDAALTLGELANIHGVAAPVAAVVLPGGRGQEGQPAGYLLFASAQGRVKRVALADFRAAASRGMTAVMGIDAADRLVGAHLTAGDEEVILVSSAGQAIRFDQSEVRPMGLPAAGVAGIKLNDDATVVGVSLVRPDADLVIVTEEGYAKRSPLKDYPGQRRYGSGVVGIRLNKRSGRVAGSATVTDKDELFLVSSKGKVSGTTPGRIPTSGRAAQGRPFLKLGTGDRVTALIAVGHDRSSPADGVDGPGDGSSSGPAGKALQATESSGKKGPASRSTKAKPPAARGSAGDGDTKARKTRGTAKRGSGQARKSSAKSSARPTRSTSPEAADTVEMATEAAPAPAKTSARGAKKKEKKKESKSSSATGSIKKPSSRSRSSKPKAQQPETRPVADEEAPKRGSKRSSRGKSSAEKTSNKPAAASKADKESAVTERPEPAATAGGAPKKRKGSGTSRQRVVTSVPSKSKGRGSANKKSKKGK